MNGQEVVTTARPGAITAEDLMPVMDMAMALKRRNFMVQVAKQLMQEGVDYGVIPGTGAKPTLLKPGAERLITLFGLSPEVIELEVTEDWDGSRNNGEPLFYYRYKIRLTRNGIVIGEGIGSCSSRESKYRYRQGERKCPKCGKPAIIKGREEYGGGWLCFAKRGGCGEKYKAGDAAIEGQSVARIENPDIADVVNTIQKMAHKRALVAAVLIATNASEFYTQDLDDAAQEPVSVTPPTPPAGEYKPVKSLDRPWVNNRVEADAPDMGQDADTDKWVAPMIGGFQELKARLPGQYAHLYYDVLKATGGVAHSNELKKDRALALETYRQLLRVVEEIEKSAGQGDAAETETPHLSAAAKQRLNEIAPKTAPSGVKP